MGYGLLELTYLPGVPVPTPAHCLGSSYIKLCLFIEQSLNLPQTVGAL